MAKVSELASWAWVGIWLVVSGIIVDEELGVHHFLGMQPITWVAVSDPRLFWSIMAGFLDLAAWWAVHVYLRKYGDLKKSNEN